MTIDYALQIARGETYIQTVDEIDYEREAKDVIFNAIRNGTLLKAQPTDEIKEAYLKGYDYGVKDWFKSKTQPCEDAINREAAINTAISAADDWDGGCDAYREEMIREALEALPPVTPERPKGNWVYKMQVMNNPYTYKCSVCKGWEKDKTKYCPNCGAEMEGEENV